MEGVLEIVITLLLGLLILQYLKQLWSSRNYPPGPFQFPLIGGLWRMTTGISHETFTKLAKQYGNIYTLWFGQHPAVFLSGFQVMQEAMINHSADFTDRPEIASLKFFEEHTYGVGFSNGPIWKQHQRFFLAVLRKMGVGGKIMENQINEEAQHLVETFAQAQGQPFDPVLPITNAISISRAVIGYKYFDQGEDFQKNFEVFYLLSASVTALSVVLYEMFPRRMIHLPGNHQKLLPSAKKTLSFVKGEIEKHKQNGNQEEPQDIIDFYLREMEKSRGDSNSTYNEDTLVHSVIDLFIAGTETTASTFQWALLFMVAYPDVQERVYKEMEDTLNSASICYQDHKNLPYTNAVIHEILRAGYIFFLGVPRECVNDVKLCGFQIPKGTWVIPDQRSIFLDPEQWETPEEFNPHHFLDKEGNFRARETFLPFGAGARVCLGEQMARMELFLFLTQLLKAFKFQLPEGVKEPNIEPKLGFSLHPHPYKICAIPRSSSA